MPKALLNGVELYFEVHGKGTPLLLLAAFATHHLMWQKSLGSLSKSYKLILLDNRGSGKSAIPKPPYSLEELAKDALALLDHLGISKCHILGFSMGSLIAQKLCLIAPDRVTKCILGTPFCKLPMHAKRHFQTTGKLLGSGVEPRLIFESSLPWLFSESFLSNPEAVEQQLQNMLNDPFPLAYEGFMGLGAVLLEANLEPFIGAIRTPTLLFAGEEDLLTPLSCAQTILAKMPHAKVITVPKMGHMIPFEQPSLTLDIVQEFLG